MKCTDPPAFDDFRPARTTADLVEAFLGGESVRVEANVLGLLLGTFQFRRARDQGLGGFQMKAPCGQLPGGQVVLQAGEELVFNIFDRGAEPVRVLTLGGARAEVHQVAKQLFRGLPPVFHHQDNGVILCIGERQSRLIEDALDFHLQHRKGVFRRQRSILGRHGAGQDQNQNHQNNRDFQIDSSMNKRQQLYGQFNGQSDGTIQISTADSLRLLYYLFRESPCGLESLERSDPPVYNQRGFHQKFHQEVRGNSMRMPK